VATRTGPAPEKRDRRSVSENLFQEVWRTEAQKSIAGSEYRLGPQTEILAGARM